MKVNSIRLLSSITFIAAVGSTAVAHAEPETKYKTITATLSLNIKSRDDKFSATSYADTNGKRMVLSRKEVPAKGELEFQVDGLPKMVSKNFSPKLANNSVVIEVVDSATGKTFVARTPGMSEIKMAFSAPRNCYEYDEKARDQMIQNETSALSTQVPGIVKAALADAEISEYVQLKAGTEPAVIGISNSRGSHDECLSFSNDLDKTVMTHEPSTVSVVLQMTVVDQPNQPDLSNVSLEMKKPELIPGGFKFKAPPTHNL